MSFLFEFQDFFRTLVCLSHNTLGQFTIILRPKKQKNKCISSCATKSHLKKKIRQANISFGVAETVQGKDWNLFWSDTH